MRRPFCLLAVTLGALLWSAALFAAPSAAPPRVSAFVYAAGSLICHQRPERSFHQHDVQYPVCARCLGLYTGALAGVALWCAASGLGSSPSRRVAAITVARWRWAIIFVGAPTILSVLTGFAGWWDANNATRAALAVPLGACLAALVAAGAAGDLR